MDVRQWHGFVAMIQALFGECYYLPFLLVFTLLAWKSFRKSPGLNFFLVFLGLTFGWRLIFAMSLNIEGRYVQLTGLCSLVVVSAGAVAFGRILQYIGTHFNLKGLSNSSFILTGVLIAGLGIGKALNPPDPKAYVFQIAAELKENAGDRAVLIDSSGEYVRLKSLLPEAWQIRSVKYPYDSAIFWTNFLTELQTQQFNTDQLWVIIRTPIGLPKNQFENDFKQLWNFFPFEYKKSFASKRYLHTIYRFNFLTGYNNTAYVTAENKNPLSINLPPIIHTAIGNETKINFSETVPQWKPENNIYFDVQSSGHGKVDAQNWYFQPSGTAKESFPLVLTAYNALGWPVGRGQTTISVNDHNDNTADAAPNALKKDTSIALGANGSRLLPLPVRLTLSHDMPWRPINLTGLAPASDWSFSVNHITGDIFTPDPNWTKAEFEGHCTDGKQYLKTILLTPPQRSDSKERNILWLGTREISSPDFFKSLESSAADQGLKINFISTLKSQKYEYSARPSWNSLTSAGHNNPFFDNSGKLDFNRYLKTNRLPPIDFVVLALGDEEILLGNRFFMPFQRTLPSDIRQFVSTLRQQWPNTGVIVILPPVPPRSQNSYAANSGNTFLYQFAYRKILNHGLFIQNSLDNLDPSEVKIIPLYLFWKTPGDWEQEKSEKYHLVELNSFSKSGIDKTIKLLLNEINHTGQ